MPNVHGGKHVWSKFTPRKPHTATSSLNSKPSLGEKKNLKFLYLSLITKVSYIVWSQYSCGNSSRISGKWPFGRVENFPLHQCIWSPVVSKLLGRLIFWKSFKCVLKLKVRKLWGQRDNTVRRMCVFYVVNLGSIIVISYASQNTVRRDPWIQNQE